MIPRKNGIEAEGIPSVSVETSDTSIPRKPIFIEGGDVPAVIESLSVTENGTYTVPEGVDGYNPVNVNVSDVPAVIESLSVTENGTYTVPEGVDGFNPVTVDVEGSAVYSPTYIKFQKYFREPEIGHICGPDESLIYTDWVYLESAGQVVVPAFPNDGLATKTIVSDVQNPNFENITNATIFYCFSSDTDPRARGSYPNELTYTQSHNQQVAPTKIYSYTPGGAFEWTEVTIDASTWDNKGYYNYIDRIIYAPVDIMRNTVSSIVFYQLQNLIGESGKISDPYKTDYFDVYYCSQGTILNDLNAVTTPAIVQYIGNMTLKGMYDLLSGGSFPPNE